MISVVTVIASEFGSFFSVKPVVGNLTFEVSKGRYQRPLIERGYSPNEACAADCSPLFGVAAPARYCSTGVAADAVLSVTKPPTIEGVAGSGGSCAVDQNGRPVWLVFSWISSLDGLGIDHAANVRAYRHLVTHELVHALGFSNGAFRSARDASGARKQLIALESVIDVDGERDEVWHFKRGRAYELAQDYFGCHGGEEAWRGLPLMGRPELGRASHWETRIMRDDVMSYGNVAPMLSSITLAAMEDLGWYLSNYSSAHCMLWGYQQGCAYVDSRCGLGAADRSATTSSASLCEGDAAWRLSRDEYLEAKCAGGTDPCSSLEKSGYAVVGGARVCNAQCYSPIERRNCSVAPLAAPASAGASAPSGPLTAEWILWLWLLVWLGGGLFLVGAVRVVLCPAGGSAPIALSLALVVAVFGAGALSFAIWALYFTDAFDAFGGWFLWSAFALGLSLVLISGAILVGVRMRFRRILTAVAVLLAVVLVGEVAFSVALLYWSYSVYEVSEDTNDTLEGRSAGRWEGKFGHQALEQVEAFVCNTYTACCRDPALSDDGTCIHSHEGTATDLQLTLDDPSQPAFCPYISGTDSTFHASAATCEGVEWVVPGLSLPECRQTFCTIGVEGYLTFVDLLVQWMRSNAEYIGGGMAVCVLLQLVLLANLWQLRNARGRSHVHPRLSKQPSSRLSRQLHYGVRMSEPAQVFDTLVTRSTPVSRTREQLALPRRLPSPLKQSDAKTSIGHLPAPRARGVAELPVGRRTLDC